MLNTLLIIYVIGLIAAIIVLLTTIAKEPTAHGQGVLMSVGCLVVIAWPLAFCVAAFAGIVALGGWVKTKVGKS